MSDETASGWPELGRRYAARWDPLARPMISDHGFIGEDKTGIWLRRHPDACFALAPSLWHAVTEFQSGRHDVGERPEDLALRSAYELAIHRELQAAYARELERRAVERAMSCG